MEGGNARTGGIEALQQELREATEREAAISEILRAISSSPTDVQPVLDAIAEHAARYCAAEDILINLLSEDGTLLLHRASHGPLGAHPPLPRDRTTLTGRAVVDKRTVHVADMQAEMAEYPLGSRIAAELGFHTAVATPLLAEGAPIGAMIMRRVRVQPFTEQQVSLLRTFADQAVIAIENVRLFNETKEALDQQTATSDILKVIATSPTNVQPVLDAIAQNAARVCGASDAHVYRVDGDRLKQAAHVGPIPGLEPDESLPLDRGSLVGRCIVDRRTIHIRDAAIDLDPSEYPISFQLQRRWGYRTSLSVPLLRGNVAIGGIAIRRTEVRPFTPKQIELLQTFAAQAVIAIENVRLFNETTEALARQTATSEVLQAISRTAFDLDAVLSTVLENAMQLCDSTFAGLYRREGDLFHLAVARGVSAQWVRNTREHPPDIHGGGLNARVTVKKTPVHIHDVLGDPEYGYKETALSGGFRTLLGVPLLRNGDVVGVLSLARADVRDYSASEIDLVRTFADQAAIAIENVRLFSETKDALDRQTALGEILRVIAASPSDITPVLDAIAESAARFCVSENVSVILLQEDGRIQVHAHVGTLDTRVPSWVLDRTTVSGRSIVDAQTIQVPDLQAAGDEYPLGQAQALVLNERTTLAAPLIRDGRGIGALLLRRGEVRPFSDKQVELVKVFADQAVIAIENVRLINETNRALEQQTATADVLRLISRSTFELAPVLDALIETSTRLANAQSGAIFGLEGDQYRLMATYGLTAEVREMQLGLVSSAATGSSIAARTGRALQPIQIVDVLEDPEASPTLLKLAKAEGARTFLGVPLLREGVAIGVLSLRRKEVDPFSESEIALVSTYADQAVIAIENVRLFNETKEALERQTATSELLAAMSQSAFDLKPVFEMVLDRSLALCHAQYGWIHEFDDHDHTLLNVAAQMSETMAPIAYAEGRWRASERSLVGRVCRERRTLHVADLLADPTVSGSRAIIANGARTGLGVPLLRGDELLGAIIIVRIEVHPFDTREIELVESFANQAAIAIENVRLFNQIREKSGQLEVANEDLAAASRHKSEFLANMSHELRTPLNAIIGFSDVLEQRLFGELNERQSEYTRDIASSGRHLLDLVNEILDLSKVEAGRMELEPSEFALGDTIHGALAFVRERAAGHGIELGADVPADLGTVVADERKVRQVLLNLLSNAVKFTPDGGTIGVRARRSNGEVEVSVRDTGIGIAPEDQARVFDEFQQVGKASDRSREGTGLGLTLAKRFIELHHGRIWIESELGKGTTFTFAIPLSRASA